MRRRPWLLVAALAAGCSGGDAPSSAAGDEPIDLPLLERATAAEVPLEVGQCGDVDSLAAGQPIDPATIRTAPCTQGHVLEVIAVLDFPAEPSVAFPGTDAVDGHAADVCIEAFPEYVGRPYLESNLDVVVVAPDAAGWARGDRRIACLAYDVDFELVTGTVRGSGL